VKQHAPAAERNREPILGALRQVLPEAGRVLEIASGTGQHAAWLAPRFPSLTWQPTDPDAVALASIAAWRAEIAAPNLSAPLEVDVRAPAWWTRAELACDAMVCINMIHIAPWSACEGLVDGACRLLGEGAPLVLYGPFRFGGVFTAPSNEAFDASLRARDPAWGVRELDDVTALCAKRGLERSLVLALPANNHAVIFRRVGERRA
jgi:SAM-dependent methyltransferase